MRGVVGEYKTNYVSFTITGLEYPYSELSIVNGSQHSDPRGYYIGFNQKEILEGKLTYRDLISTIHVSFKKDLASPKVRIYCGITNGQNLQVPEFFIEDYLTIREITNTGEKLTLEGDKLNKALLLGKSINVNKRLFFEKVDDPLVVTIVKDTPIGEIRSFKKRTTGVEF